MLKYPTILATASPTPLIFLCAQDTIAPQPESVPSEIVLTMAPQFDVLAAVAGQPKRFTMVAYTGVPLRLPNFPYPMIVDAAGISLASQNLPILKDHDQKQIVGHSESITIIKATGLITVAGVVSGQGPAAQEVRDLAGNQFPWQSSIGAPAHEIEFVDLGETVTVNGRAWQGPVYVARKTTLREISFVALGADASTSARIAASQHLEGATAMKFEEWIKAMKWDPTTLSAEQRILLQASYDAEQVKKNPPPVPAVPVPLPADHVAELRATMTAESKRVQAVRKHCKDHPEIEIKAIGEGWTEAQTELEVLRASRAAGPFVHTGGGQTEINASLCFEASLCITAGLKEERVGKWFDAKVLNEALSARFKGANISSVMFETIRAAGLHARPGAINDDTIRTALRAERRIRSGLIQASGFTSLSLSGVLSNVANKSMLASYEAQQVVWPLFCAVRNHSDFKTHTRYRLTSTGSLRKVGPDGELKHIGREETSYTNQLDTFGALITLNRQMQINDDLGAFLELPNELGFLAAIRPEEAFFVLLLANTNSFFHANNKNLVSGAGGVMTAANAVAAITAAELKFSNQVSANNKPIMVPPTRILCGTENYVPCRNAYNGGLKITGKDQTEVSANEHAGKYEPHKSAFVNNTSVKDEDGAAITGQSSTAWWLFADPARRAAFGMAFLNGNQVPTIENDDAEFGTLGMQWRAYFDFGCGQEDPAAAVQVNGA